VLQLALHDGVDPDSGEAVGPRTGDARAFETFQQVYNAYRRQMEFLLARSMENIRAHERQWPESNPSPLLAGTIDDCLARGRDVGQGGARYNSVGSIGVALGSTVDSLAALRQAVFEEKRFTMGQILDATARNFEGDEPMRQYLANRVPKWGNGDGQVDALAREIGRHYCRTVHSMTNARGGPCQGALFALRFQWYYGQRTGALPDGRKAHTPLAPGVGASPGRDRRGVTALIQSVSALDFTLTPDGSVLDIMLHPSSIRGEKGIDSIVTLIKTFFAQGGYGLQFNVFDTEMLRDAQRDPEQYANLQIRVTGYSAHFTKLSAYEQDLFIARNTHTA
jgi:formate C-acetyltransferase